MTGGPEWSAGPQARRRNAGTSCWSRYARLTLRPVSRRALGMIFALRVCFRSSESIENQCWHNDFPSEKEVLPPGFEPGTKGL